MFLDFSGSRAPGLNCAEGPYWPPLPLFSHSLISFGHNWHVCTQSIWPKLVFHSYWASVWCPATSWALQPWAMSALDIPLLLRFCWYSVMKQWNYRIVGSDHQSPGCHSNNAVCCFHACEWPVIFQLHSRSGRLVEVVMEVRSHGVIIRKGTLDDYLCSCSLWVTLDCC